ncbi:MAG TPA: oligoendopeptidase F [bacterium]
MDELTLRPRSAIPVEHTWDASSVFPTDEAWEAAFRQTDETLPQLLRFAGRLGENPAMLADWFEEAQNLFRTLRQVVVYAQLGHTADTMDQDAFARVDRARGLMARTTGAAAFGDPEIVSIGFAKLRQWLRDEPRLRIYEHYIDRLERRQAHLRSPEVEALLGMLIDPFRTASATHGVLADADLTFRAALGADAARPIEVGQGNLGALLGHPDREVRRTAWESYADAHLEHKNAMANCIAAGVKQNVFLARARRYESALDAALTPHDIPVAVFHNLLATYRRNLPAWHRYWRVRRQALGYAQLHPYDRNAPLTSSKPTIPFVKAVEWICDGMAPLGAEYVGVMRRGLLEERWVDIYPNKGKRAGAFSTGGPGTHPFILMSYADDVYSLSTLAHELGHSMHSYYAWRTQPVVYANYSTFVAEVASNFNQAMVRAHLLAAHPDRELQIAIIEEAMANFYRYLFLMPILAAFELEIHQRVERGEGLTAKSLMSLMADLFAEGYGGEVALDADRVGITWAEFPTHLYLNFYVFQYSTGISGAHALADRVLHGPEETVDAYLEFLKAGGSRYPIDLLRSAGVDLASPEPVEKMFEIFSAMVARLEALVT